MDGHSIIFHWPELSQRHAHKQAEARAELVRILTELQDCSDWDVAVVFDGKGARASESSEPGGIQVFYSARGQTADSIIERLVAKYSQKYQVTVATDDYLERTTVESLGGRAMSSLQLLDEIQFARNSLNEKLRQMRKCF